MACVANQNFTSNDQSPVLNGSFSTDKKANKKYNWVVTLKCEPGHVICCHIERQFTF